MEMKKEINLQIFCSNERTGFEKPFVDNGFEYATDGRILVAVKTDKPDTESRRPKDCRQLFERIWDEGWKPVKMSMPERTTHKCCFCNGDGIKRDQCNICDGFGLHTCDCGTEHTCGYCDEGEILSETGVKCTMCEGVGKAFKNLTYPALDLFFAGFRIAKIVRHLSDPQITEISTKTKCLRFEFNGGKGLLMSMKEDSYKIR